MSAPLVSVVVPAYQVQEWLRPCLDSIAGQTVDDLEIVVVDDGSPDATGDIADAFAKDHPRCQVLHTPNGGLSAARNTGAAVATGQYLLFVDSDDLLPRKALERLLGSARRTGSWVVSGGVRRWDERTVSQTQLHRIGLSRPLEKGHITRDTRLVYDTTAWNKLVLREFWVDAGLEYPVGKLYEDLATSFATHLATNSTDVVPEPVYLWRIRTGNERSITQRLDEVMGLEHRMEALASVDALAVGSGVEALRDAHDGKVLDIDMRRFVNFLPTADDAYRARFLDLAAGFLDHVPDRVLAGRDPLRRLILDGVREQDLDLLLDVALARRATGEGLGGRLGLLRRDLRVQGELRRRGYQQGRVWARSTLNRTVYHLLPPRLRRRAADQRFGRDTVTDPLAV